MKFDAHRAPHCNPHVACPPVTVRGWLQAGTGTTSTSSVQERRICYPVSQLQEEEEEEVLSLAESADAETAERYSDWWGLERYYKFSTDEEDDQIFDGMAQPQEFATPAPPQVRTPDVPKPATCT